MAGPCQAALWHGAAGDGGLVVGWCLAKCPGYCLRSLLAPPWRWDFHHSRSCPRAPLPEEWRVTTAAIAIIAVVLAAIAPRSQTQDRTQIPWRTFSSGELRTLVGAGRTVFVDVTADWCITCKINKALVIDRQEVAGRLSADVVPMRADWTRPGDEIAGFMREHGRFGIPFNIVFGPAARDGIALPEILSTSTVSAAFNAAAAASNNPSAETGHTMKKSIIAAVAAFTLSLGATIGFVPGIGERARTPSGKACFVIPMSLPSEIPRATSPSLNTSIISVPTARRSPPSLSSSPGRTASCGS